METAQLAYFLLACRFRNHAEAAQSAGVSASALSENIDALERELGLALFQRGPRGHSPTEAALWLHQTVEPLLQAVEAIETLFLQATQASARRIEVVSPLQFMAGKLSSAASLAIRSLARAEPGLIGGAKFALPRSFADFGAESPSTPTTAPSPAASRVLIDYAADAIAPEDVLLFEDRWVAASRAHTRAGEPRAPLSLDRLRLAAVLVPALAEAQMRQVVRYCVRQGLPEPQVIEEDISTFASLERSAQAFHLIAPFSLIAASAARSSLVLDDLPEPLTTSVIARAGLEDRLGRRYIAHLAAALEAPDPIVYRPAISLKQLRYFLALADRPNVTGSARLLHVAQPALSKQLRKLEETLGCTLFERRQTGLLPLPAADRLAEILRPVLAALDGVAATAAHYAASRRERLTIGLLPAADHDGLLARGVAGAIEAWSRLYPKVELRIVEGSTETLKRWVEAGDIGLALVEAQVSRSWQADLAFEDVFGLVTSGARPPRVTGSISLREALETPLALPGASFGLRKLLDKAAADIAHRIAPRMEINALPILLALVKRTDLATILPSSAVSALVESGAFRFTPIRDPVITRRLSILFSPDRSLTDIERDLIAILRRRLGDEAPSGVATPLPAAPANA